jgi:hypothetical protein
VSVVLATWEVRQQDRLNPGDCDQPRQYCKTWYQKNSQYVYSTFQCLKIISLATSGIMSEPWNTLIFKFHIIISYLYIIYILYPVLYMYIYSCHMFLFDEVSLTPAGYCDCCLLCSQSSFDFPIYIVPPLHLGNWGLGNCELWIVSLNLEILYLALL